MEGHTGPARAVPTLVLAWWRSRSWSLPSEVAATATSDWVHALRTPVSLSDIEQHPHPEGDRGRRAADFSERASRAQAGVLLLRFAVVVAAVVAVVQFADCPERAVEVALQIGIPPSLAKPTVTTTANPGAPDEAPITMVVPALLELELAVPHMAPGLAVGVERPPRTTQ